MLSETASQTAGPFLHIGMAPRAAGIDVRANEPMNVLAGAGAEGQRIRLEGVIYDGTGSLVRDAQVEIWQANAHGKHDHPDDRQDKPVDPAFSGFGRTVTDFESGLWWFDTIKPGRVNGRNGAPMAPHISVALFSRGINIHLNTRIYFADEAEANAGDSVLRLVEPVARRKTLMAERRTEGGQTIYRFDIRLQGQDETVFFDV